jgi:transcription elongation GreA/GreB family factor
MGGVRRLGHAWSVTSAQPIIGASEFAECELELDRLRAVRAENLPDRMRRARVEAEYERTGRRVSFRLNGIASGGDGRSVSARSPVGRALLGRRVGDVVSVELPSGRVESLQIVAISAPPAADAA